MLEKEGLKPTPSTHTKFSSENLGPKIFSDRTVMKKPNYKWEQQLKKIMDLLNAADTVIASMGYSI